jgi:thioredoxin 1
MMQTIDGEDNFQKDVLQSKLPVLVDFWAEWCGPCRAAAPILDKLSTEYDGRVDFAKVNVDGNSPLAAKYGIAAIPTTIIFKDGQPVQQVVGLKSQKELKKILDGILG